MGDGMRVAANLSMMFQEAGALLTRYEAASNEGFKYIEVPFPYIENAETVLEAAEKHNLKHVLFNAPAGDWAKGDRGLTCIPERKHEFHESVEKAVAYAKALSCQKIHFMAGLCPLESVSHHLGTEETYIENLQFALDRTAKEGITCLIEPINHFTMPGYFLCSIEQALGYLDRLESPNLQIMLDIFHVQQICGSITATINRVISKTGHVQVAQAPNRDQPDAPGEINYSYVFDVLRRAGYRGFVGCEYKPTGPTADSLAWIKRYGLSMQ